MPNMRITNRRRGPSKLPRRLLPGPSSPSTGAQKIVKVTLNGSSTMLSTQATTGLFTTSSLTPTLGALAKTSNWKAVFDEYRLVGVDFYIRAISSSNGISNFLVDDEDATGENATWFESRPDRSLIVNNSASPQSHTVIRWRSQDLEDMEWRSTYNEASFSPCTLKFYTSLTEYGTPASVTGMYYVNWVGHFEFRGVGANN